MSPSLTPAQALRPLCLDVVTIFPDYLRVLDLSLIGKASSTGLIDLRVHDLREWTHDRHRSVDDTPVGGGAGMVMRPDVWGQALDEVLGGEGVPSLQDQDRARQVLVVPTPSGEPFSQRTAEDLAKADQIVFACGRYEGIDARVAEHYRSGGVEVRELSIGDYVLNGGEVAALVMIEAIARLRPGVLGNPESVVEESHGVAGLLEHPVYTRPITWRGMDLAASEPVLLSGDHARISRARRDQAIARTAARRPDMVAALDPDTLDAWDRAVLARHGWIVPQGAEGPVPVRLRQATSADLPGLVEDGASESLDGAQEPPLGREHLTSWAQDPRARLVVAELAHSGTGVVGHTVVLLEQADAQGALPLGASPRPQEVDGAAGPNTLVAQVRALDVAPSVRGSGLRAALLDEAVGHCQDAGVGLLWLAADASDRHLQKELRSMGFAKVGARLRQAGGRRLRESVMALGTGPGAQ